MPRPNFQFSILSSPFAILLALVVPAFPQATFPSPTLTSISPLGGRPGTSVDLTFRGTDLDGPLAVLLGSHKLPAKSIKTNVLSVSLPAELKPGQYDIRFVGSYGVSNPRVFEVSAFDAIESPGTNSTPDKAIEVALDTALQGVFKAATPHCFTFEAKAGDHVTARFDGHRFDTQTELVGTITDGSGRELARLRQGQLDFTAKSSGRYHLRLHDLMYRTGDDYGFRLTLARSTSAPSAPGTRTATPRSIKIGETVRDNFLPLGLAHSFDLPFKSGDKFVIEVLSHQLDHPTDPHLVVENLKADGTLSAQSEVADAPAITPAPSIVLRSRDPSYAYEAKADGTFRISLNDNFNTTEPFELRVVKDAAKRPLIALNAILPGAKAKTAEIGSSNVGRNGIAAFEVIAPNRNALSQPIEIKVGNLPAGVTCLGGFIGSGQSFGYVAFQAAADAPSGGSVLSGIDHSQFVSFPMADTSRGQALYRTAGAPALGVSAQNAPALVQTETSGVQEVVAGAKLDIALKVTRQPEFVDAITLKALGLVDAAKAPTAVIAAKATSGKFTLDTKALKLAPGEYGLILQGPAKMKVRRGLEAFTAAQVAAKKAADDQAASKKKLDAANADKTPQKDALVKAATAALKTADAAKAAADKLVKDLTAKSAAKDATFAVYSNPIRIRVTDAAKK